MRKIGIYGGTFDPVHMGHLILGRDAVESLSLDRLLFLPAAQSPHKQDRIPASAELRLAMLEAAIADEQALTLDPREVNRPPPSYTIDTLHELKHAYADAHFFLIIGQDQLSALHTWKEADRLLSECTPVVLARESHSVERFHLHLPRTVQISSTEIRRRVAAGKSIRYLVPEPVREIIEAHQLYRKE